MRIHLSGYGGGRFALIDDEDAWLSRYAWKAVRRVRADGTEVFYATRRPSVGGERKDVFMHKVLCEASEVDHVNGDGLDNRRKNLRPATKAQNQYNSRRSSANTSGRKGVSFRKSEKRWHAYISANGVRKDLGLYRNLADAVRAREAAERQLHGEYARAI